MENQSYQNRIVLSTRNKKKKRSSIVQFALFDDSHIHRQMLHQLLTTAKTFPFFALPTDVVDSTFEVDLFLFFISQDWMVKSSS